MNDDEDNLEVTTTSDGVEGGFEIIEGEKGCTKVQIAAISCRYLRVFV